MSRFASLSRRAALTFTLALLPVTDSLQARAEAPAAEGETITIFAAASLKNSLDSAAAAYEKASGQKAVISYAASSALAKQIEQSAPADIFISADIDWMTYLVERSLIKPGTEFNLLGNRLVLVAPAAAKTELKIAKDFPLSDTLADGKLAMADVKAVPAGKYAKAALEHLGVWSAVEPKIAQSDNVRSALALVARGEAPLGIVYQSDAASEPKVKIVDTFPADSHAPIIYPLGIMVQSAKADAAEGFIKYLKSDEGHKHFTARGFTALK